MPSKISMFPILSSSMIDEIGLKFNDYEFFFSLKEEEFLLANEKLNKSDQTGRVIDKNGVWNSKNNNLIIRRKFTIDNSNMLFGEKGIICKDAILGIALSWSCSGCKHRDSIPVGEIKYDSKNIKQKVFYIDYEFKKSFLKGSLELRVVLYIKSKGTPKKEEEHLANEEGCILGELDKYLVEVDGVGSLFPIYEINEPNKPLWKISLEWEDPTYSSFSDSVAIYINKNHKSYKYLDKSKKTFNSELLKEIMTRTMLILIMKVKESAYWEATINGEDLEVGSVSQLIYYFITTLKWDISSIESLSDSIEDFFEKRICINEDKGIN